MNQSVIRTQHLQQRQASNTHISSFPVLALCKVVDFENADPISGLPETVNIAAAFTYTVQVQQGDNIITYEKVKPAVERIASPVLVNALGKEPSQPYWGAAVNGVFYLMTAEQIYTAPCGGTPDDPPTP